MLKKLKLNSSIRPSRINTQKRKLFHHRGLECRVGSQEMPGVIGKAGLGVQNEAEQRLTEFLPRECTGIVNTLFQQHKRRLYMWTSLDGQY